MFEKGLEKLAKNVSEFDVITVLCWWRWPETGFDSMKEMRTCFTSLHSKSKCFFFSFSSYDIIAIVLVIYEPKINYLKKNDISLFPNCLYDFHLKQKKNVRKIMLVLKRLLNLKNEIFKIFKKIETAVTKSFFFKTKILHFFSFHQFALHCNILMNMHD